MTRRLRFWAVMMALAAPGSAAAQGPSSAGPGPTQTVLQNPSEGQPIHIESTSLEVRDKSKVATFTGDVVVVQGDTTIKCQTLVVFYGAQENAGAGKHVAGVQPAAGTSQSGQSRAAPVVPQGEQDIRKIEARGGVTVVSKDQNASGDLGVYDPKAKTITLIGNVVVSQGKNVLHGDQVVVNTATGDALFESPTQNRVRALFQSDKNDIGAPSNVMSAGPSRTN